MAIDVLIKQGSSVNKTIPLEVILGDNLYYGNFVNDQLNVGELGDQEFIAYNPNSIGRGFSVVWNPDEKQSIALRLLQPTTTQELNDFYSAIKRIADYWEGQVIFDGTAISACDLMNSFEAMVDTNYKAINHFSQKVLGGELEMLTLYSAMWPLIVGKEEAVFFLENPDYYAKWLHEKQSIDVYYATPDYFVGKNGVFGRYILVNDTPTVFPYKPAVSFGVTDSETGNALECNEWVALIAIQGEKAPICQIEYSKLLDIIPESKVCKYDAGHFLVDELTADEIRNLFAG